MSTFKRGRPLTRRPTWQFPVQPTRDFTCDWILRMSPTSQGWLLETWNLFKRNQSLAPRLFGFADSNMLVTRWFVACRKERREAGSRACEHAWREHEVGIVRLFRNQQQVEFWNYPDGRGSKLLPGHSFWVCFHRSLVKLWTAAHGHKSIPQAGGLNRAAQLLRFGCWRPIHRACCMYRWQSSIVLYACVCVWQIQQCTSIDYFSWDALLSFLKHMILAQCRTLLINNFLGLWVTLLSLENRVGEASFEWSNSHRMWLDCYIIKTNPTPSFF